LILDGDHSREGLAYQAFSKHLPTFLRNKKWGLSHVTRNLVATEQIYNFGVIDRKVLPIKQSKVPKFDSRKDGTFDKVAELVRR